MGSPVICGDHDYVGFEPCPRCAAMVVHQGQPVVLNGERLVLRIETNPKPRWIPGPVWSWMVRMVVKGQTFHAEIRTAHPAGK